MCCILAAGKKWYILYSTLFTIYKVLGFLSIIWLLYMEYWITLPL